MRKWSEMTIFEKLAEIISFIAAGVWVVFTMYDKAEKLPYADLVCLISATLIGLCQAFTLWRDRRVIAYIALGGSACAIAAIVLTLA